MKKSRIAKIVFGLWAVLFAYSALSDDLAKHVIAGEVSGVVIDKETGKPIPDAIVAMRFERGNTGHSSPHCFRSIAVQADEQGRFRFASWSQEKTLANHAYGELVVHKPGYKTRPSERLLVHEESREFLGIRYSNDLHLPATTVHIELGPWLGSEAERTSEIFGIAGDFSCVWQAYNDSLPLLLSIREEMKTLPSAKIETNAYSIYMVMEKKILELQSAKK